MSTFVYNCSTTHRSVYVVFMLIAQTQTSRHIQSTLDSSSKICSKLLISQSKFSGTRKFTLRYQ